MKSDIDKLANMMGLSEYQKNVLKSRPDAYNLSRLERRGNVLYAPRVTSCGLCGFFNLIFCGRVVDLIGKNKMLVRRMRGIKFFAGGFYSVPVGRGCRYYADDCGNIITRDMLRQRCLHNN